MNEMKLKQLLLEEIPPVPEDFHRAMTDTLDRIVAQEASNAGETKARRLLPLRRVLLLAALVVLALTAAAAAAIHWQVFDDLWPFAGAPKAADQVMHSHLAQQTVNGVEITVEEAGYDGRSLLLVYSYRMLDVDTPLGAYRDGEAGPGVSSEDMQLLSDHNVGWWIDHIWFDGKAMDMPANSYGDIYGSEENGKLTEKWVYRLDNEAVQLAGPVQVSLPIGERQPLEEYSLRNHPEKYAEDGTLLLPDKGMLTFALDTSLQSQVVTETPNIPAVLENLTATVTEAAFSPLMTYITLSLEVKPEALDAYKAIHGEGYYDDEGNLICAYDGTDVMSDWIYSLQLVDGEGRIVAESGGNNGLGSDWAEFVYPAMETLPQELWLAPVQAGQADMSRAVRVR